MEKVETVHYHGVTFYVSANAGKTEQEFMDHEAHHGFTAEQLKEAYALIKKAAPKEDEAAKARPYVPSAAANNTMKTEDPAAKKV